MTLDDIELKRGGQTVIQTLGLALQPGLVHAVIGPNGSGKTSLLKAMAGELPLSAGAINMDDPALSRGALRQWRDRIAYMPQDTSIDVALTVLEVVVLGRLGKLELHVDDETLAAAFSKLEATGILHLADRDIATLSGGQRQMALFAQALMREPRVLLLDEPCSALDLHHQMALLELVCRETRAKVWITVVVLHDLNLAAQFADRIVLLVNGRIQASGCPADVLTAEQIAPAYGVPVEILRDSRGHPIVRTIRHATPVSSSTLQPEPTS